MSSLTGFSTRTNLPTLTNTQNATFTTATVNDLVVQDRVYYSNDLNVEMNNLTAYTGIDGSGNFITNIPTEQDWILQLAQGGSQAEKLFVIQPDGLQFNVGVPLTLQTLPFNDLYNVKGSTSNIQSQINNINEALKNNQGSWGSFACLYTLNNPTGNVARSAYVSNADPSNNGVNMVDNNGSGLFANVQVDKKGVYNFQFSCQLTHSSSTSHDVYFWLRKNGVDVPNTASVVTLLGNGESQVPAWNFVMDLSGGDKLGLMWASNTTNLTMPYVAPQTTPFVAPAIPSVILTITEVMNVSQGPQGAPGISPVLSVGSVSSVPYGTAPSVSITGTSTAPVLNFTLATGPQGVQGVQGPQGPRGPQGPQGGVTTEQLTEILASATAAGGGAGALAGAAAGTTAGTAAGASAGGTAGASAGATAGASAGASAGTTAAQEVIATEVQPQINTLDSQVATLQQKTSNMTNTAGIGTIFSSSVYADFLGTPEIGNGAGLSLRAQTINIKSSLPLGGTINIGNYLDAIFIQGIPFTNWNVDPFNQW